MTTRNTIKASRSENLAPGLRRIGGVPAGMQAWVIANQTTAHSIFVHIAVDDRRAQIFEQSLRFFTQDFTIHHLPAWDCPPYSHISPRPDINNRRLKTLAHLASKQNQETNPTSAPTMVITTAAAMTQKLPPPNYYHRHTLTLATDHNIKRQTLEEKLDHNGYQRVDITRSPGQFSCRGGLVDVFAIGLDQPVRLDFFGDRIDDIRCFDPISQRSTQPIQCLTIGPAREVLLSTEAINCFKDRYADLPGDNLLDDQLYQAVVDHQMAQGIEHWLPLFHVELSTLSDYIGSNANITMDTDVPTKFGQRLAQIYDNYSIRLDQISDSDRHRLAAPETLYHTLSQWEDWLVDKNPIIFSPFRLNNQDFNGQTGRVYHDIHGLDKRYSALVQDTQAAILSGTKVVLAMSNNTAMNRVGHIFTDRNHAPPIPIKSWADIPNHTDGQHFFSTIWPLEHGFISPDLVVITEQDMFAGKRLRQPAKAANILTNVQEITRGDLVVHREHGIGRYEGLRTISVDQCAHDCLQISYRGDDQLFVPVENIDVLSRFGANSSTSLDQLGSTAWHIRRAKVAERLQEMADRLLDDAAQRHLAKSDIFSADPNLYEEFCSRFDYVETEDQARAIAEVEADLASNKPMDRLICADVGFGKTEIALRATFIVASNGGQVAVLAPTTLLARQHYENFTQRFDDFGLTIGHLSRFNTTKQTAATRHSLTQGQVDIVIGTHALLSKNTSFARLKLVIIDEEQHFGVKQKERLRNLSSDSHILSLTATPIPRTLQLCLSSAHTMSLVTTPPVDRLSVRSFVTNFDPLLIRQALEREHERNGQSFYIVPHIRHMDKAADMLARIVPNLKVGIAHGKKDSRSLEQVIVDFYHKRYDILLATAIVESGLDISNVNTLIVERADMFGLAQLHQIRGRIGRSHRRGWAYFFLPRQTKISPKAEQRLEVLHNLDSLSAGFSIASHDLDMRGGGNVLGKEQSGHMREVGVDLYQQMLRDAITKAGDKLPDQDKIKDDSSAQPQSRFSPQIKVPIPCLIPQTYIPALNLRLSLYRQAGRLNNLQGVEDFAAMLLDRFGQLPPECNNFIAIVQIKTLCIQAGIDKLEVGPNGGRIHFHQQYFKHVDGLLALIGEDPSLSLRPDHSLIAQGLSSRGKQRDILDRILSLTKRLGQIAQSGPP